MGSWKEPVCWNNISLSLKHRHAKWSSRASTPFYRNVEWSFSSPSSEWGRWMQHEHTHALQWQWGLPQLRFPGHWQASVLRSVCSVDHPAHPLLVVWPSCRLACRCDLIHPPITRHSPIFREYKNITGWKRTVSKSIFILSWKLIIIKFGELHELFPVCLCCSLVIDVDPWGRGEAV